MRYFTVEKEVMRVAPVRYGVASDGAQLADEWETDEVQELTTGFAVWEYEEDGTTIGVEFYPVQTNTRDWRNNELQVLETIKYDHPTDEWQNNEW